MFIGSYNMPTHGKERKYISKIHNMTYKYPIWLTKHETTRVVIIGPKRERAKQGELCFIWLVPQRASTMTTVSSGFNIYLLSIFWNVNVKCKLKSYIWLIYNIYTTY